jgi:hypothetical protein
MSDSPPTCPHCSKPIDAGWSFCPACGKPVKAAEPAAEPVAPPAPPPDSITGRCAVLTLRPLAPDLSAIGRIVARSLARPLIDVTAGMHLSKGILARDVDPEAARRLCADLASSSLPIILIPEDQMLLPEATHLLRDVRVAGGELKASAPVPPGGAGETSLAAADLFFAVAVRIRTERRVTTTDRAESELRDRIERSIFRRMTSVRWRLLPERGEPERVAMELQYHYLVSFYTRKPLIRHDVEDRCLDFEMMQALPGEFESAAALASSIRRAAPGLATNTGFRLLEREERNLGWEEITFLSRAGARQYYDWALQLAARGQEVTL